MPYFSVVMPLYNKESFVSDAIASVLGQTFGDFELLVVDDASNDNSPEVISKMSDGRIRIISHPRNLGLSAARNTGIAAAGADFIAFLDADDLWKPLFLEKINGLIREYPQSDIFATRYSEDRGDGHDVPLSLNVRIREGESGIIEDYFESALFQPPYWFGSSVVRKSAFEKAGLFDPSVTFGEDTDWNIRANLKLKTAYLNEPLAVYRIFSQNQITTAALRYKTITDFAKYERENPGHASLKKFLDANRYFLAMSYKMEGAREKFESLSAEIDRKNLTSAQKAMLVMPVQLVRILKKAKWWLLRHGIRVTSFGR